MSFNTLWPSDFSAQATFMESLLNFAQDQDDRSAVVGIAQVNAPSLYDLLATWQNYSGDVRPLPTGARILWWNSTRNVLEQIYSSTKDVGLEASTGTIYELSPKRRTLDMGVIGADTLINAGTVVIDLVGAALLWTHIWASVNGRINTPAAAGGLQDQIATATYYNEHMEIRGSTDSRIIIDKPAVVYAPYLVYTGNLDLPSLATYMNYFLPGALTAGKDKVFIGWANGVIQPTAAPVVSLNRWLFISIGFANGHLPAMTLLKAATFAGPVGYDAGTTYVFWGLK